MSNNNSFLLQKLSQMSEILENNISNFGSLTIDQISQSYTDLKNKNLSKFLDNQLL